VCAVTSAFPQVYRVNDVPTYVQTTAFNVAPGASLIVPLDVLNSHNQYDKSVSHIQVALNLTWAPAVNMPTAIVLYLRTQNGERVATLIANGITLNAGNNFLFIADYVPSTPLYVKQSDKLTVTWEPFAGFTATFPAGGANPSIVVSSEFQFLNPRATPSDRMYQG
jgi:hypothetical protein